MYGLFRSFAVNLDVGAEALPSSILARAKSGDLMEIKMTDL